MAQVMIRRRVPCWTQPGNARDFAPVQHSPRQLRRTTRNGDRAEFPILLGCNPTANANNPTAIINKFNGSVVATINNQSGADEVWFNPGDGLYFLARSAAVGATQQLGIIDSATFASNSVFTANKRICLVTPIR